LIDPVNEDDGGRRGRGVGSHTSGIGLTAVVRISLGVAHAIDPCAAYINQSTHISTAGRGIFVAYTGCAAAASRNCRLLGAAAGGEADISTASIKIMAASITKRIDRIEISGEVVARRGGVGGGVVGVVPPPPATPPVAPCACNVPVTDGIPRMRIENNARNVQANFRVDECISIFSVSLRIRY